MSYQDNANLPIKATAKTIQEILKEQEYFIDYYQREYLWQASHISDLVNDLVENFLQNYKPEHSRNDVRNYSTYFLGSYIISQKEGKYFIIDGQQRLTSLTLLLAYLHNVENNIGTNLKEYIFSEKYGEFSFNIAAEDRQNIMDAIISNKIDSFVPDSKKSITEQNIYDRYLDIENVFPLKELEGSLHFFVDWLINKVQLIEIIAFTDDKAYTIFETMNDRGLSLTPTDMLKGFLLSNISDSSKRANAAQVWKEELLDLETNYGKSAGDFFRDWLRGKYARTTINSGTPPKDWERQATEPHRWIRENLSYLGLKESDDYYNFIMNDFRFYVKLYKIFSQAESKFNVAHPELSYASMFLPPHHLKAILFSSIEVNDTEWGKKVKIISIFIDTLFASRTWAKNKPTDAGFRGTALRYVKAFRNKTSEVLALATYKELSEGLWDTSFKGEVANLANMNSKDVFKLLARLTNFVELNTTNRNIYEEIVLSTGKESYEIEHILANPFTLNGKDFTDEEDFNQARNQIGDLLLLPKSFNASFRNLPATLKIPKYSLQNKLAATLSDVMYDDSGKLINNPRLSKFAEEHDNIKFVPYQVFTRGSLNARNKLYTELARIMWNPMNVINAVGYEKPEDLQEWVDLLVQEDPDQIIDLEIDKQTKTRTLISNTKVTLSSLIKEGLIKAPITLWSNRNIAYRVEAELLANGIIRVGNTEHIAPSAAAVDAIYVSYGAKVSISGWEFWHVKSDDGSLVKLQRLREKFLGL